jgi:hypothetical protein
MKMTLSILFLAACTAPIPLTSEERASLIDGECYQVAGHVFIPIACGCENNGPDAGPPDDQAPEYVLGTSNPWYCGWSTHENLECPDNTLCRDRVLTNFEAAVCVTMDGEIISHPPVIPIYPPDAAPMPDAKPRCQVHDDCGSGLTCLEGICYSSGELERF